MFKVRIKNFQSIEDATVVVKGLTVVTGANNHGKSSAQRAIRGVFQNTRGTNFIRHGTPSTVVTVEFEDGRTVQWSKGRAKGDKPTYILDGDAKHPIHPGQGVPDEVRALGVQAITAGGQTLWPQFARQIKDVLFLIDEPGAVLAEAVADVDRVSKLNEALRASESDRRAASTELKVRQTDVERLRGRLSGFEGLDTVAETVHQMEEKEKKVTVLDTALSTLSRLRDRWISTTGTVRRLQDVEQISIPEESLLTQIRELSQEGTQLEGLRDQHVAAAKQVQRLEGISRVVVPEEALFKEAAAAATECLALRGLSGSLDAAQTRVAQFQGIEEVSVEFDFTQVERTLTAYQLLVDLRNRVSTATATVVSLEKELARAEEELGKTTQLLKDLLGGYEACPLCGSTVDHSC